MKKQELSLNDIGLSFLSFYSLKCFLFTNPYSHVAQGIRFAVDNGAAIINMSFVGKDFSQYLSDAIQYAHSKNVLVVVASGNERGNTANYYPASDQKVLVVSAVDQNDTIASFSNTGSSVDVSAPGVGIISTVPGDLFESHSGTSMAVPYVSGIAAMLKLDEPIRSVRGIENLLKKYVDDRGAIGWDSQYGEGIVNFASYGESLIVDNGQHVVSKEEKVAVIPKPTTEIISLPEHKNVALDKVWTIQFNRQLTERDIISIKLFTNDKEIPISLTPNRARKEILVSATGAYHPGTAYRLMIHVEKGKKYQMDFVTGF
jgi:subtilisin family serine protease